jgi:beta-lactamase class A
MGEGLDGVGWSVCVREVGSGACLAAVEADVVRPVASVGKVLLLVEVARRFALGELGREEMLGREAVAAVGDSGLWQHLAVEALPAADLAALVGAVSDNLATNVLLRRVGLEAVARTAREVGLRDTRLHDRVRDARGPDDPDTLATGTASELAGLFARLARKAVVSSEVSAQVTRWLAAGTDLSMVAAAFGLDPLAHAAEELWNKTGTDAGVRAEVGVLAGSVSYAVLAEWPPDGPDRRAEVLTAMREVGERLRGGTIP